MVDDYRFTKKATPVSIDTDYKPVQQRVVQGSAARILCMSPNAGANLTPAFDVDRIIRYFHKQNNRLGGLY